MNAAVLYRCLAVALALAVAPSSGAAGEIRVDLDPELTRVSFTLKATLHTVEGTAQLASGSLVIDPETSAVAGEIVVDAASTDTGNTGRDKKMHGKVLLSAGHPQIVFRPTHLEGSLSNGAKTGITLVGDIELLGEPHQISIPLDIRIDGSHFEATAEFSVPYVEWGLEDPSTFVLRVAKGVQVRVTAEGTIAFGDGG